MNYTEEQKNELEALSEIYYNEITINSDNPPISFSIKPQMLDPSVELLFDLPISYPDEKPTIKIVDYEELDDYEVSELLDYLDQKAEESLGTVMIFTLVGEVVEWLAGRSEREALEFEVKEKVQQEIEAEEKRKQEGTPVTVETFLAWKAKFDAERLAQQSEEATSAPNRLTGREMFETDATLAESDLNLEDLDINQIEALLEDVEV